MNTGGADGFFILTDVTPASPGLYHVSNDRVTELCSAPFEGDVEERYLVPIIKDYTKANKQIELDGYDAYCFVVKDHPTPRAQRYITWGETHGYHQRSVTRNQRPWYRPTNQMTSAARILVPRSFNDSFVFHYNPRQFLSLRFYRLHVKKGSEIQLVAYLNTTLVALAVETLGNKALGQGVLDFFMADFLVMRMPVVESQDWEHAFKELKKRHVLSIWNELGLPKPNKDYSNVRPEDVSLDKVLPDRRALDKVVFEALGLTGEEQLEVYRAVVQLVKDRLSKARSV